MTKRNLTILVSGMVAAVPHQGGAGWAVLQYVLGLKRLGHHIYFVEPAPEASSQSLNIPLMRSDMARYFRQFVTDWGLTETSALLRETTRETVGMPYSELCRVARRTDVLINISGLLRDKSFLGAFPLRIYLDLDPAFTQLWHATQSIDMGFDGHTHFVTVGLGIGKEGCAIPTCGLNWITTLQPIVLAHWPRANHISIDALTTVANWRGYGSIIHDGTFYGQKAHSFRTFIGLPKAATERFMLALAIHPTETKDLNALTENGWELLDPLTVAATPAMYRTFIQGSKAEIGLAKSGYVVSRSGWFSDRSICYLASGRPVIGQDTGFSNFLPTGKGLFNFTTTEDVLASIGELKRDYNSHSRNASDIAEEYFDSRKVLTQLLEKVSAW